MIFVAEVLFGSAYSFPQLSEPGALDWDFKKRKNAQEGDGNNQLRKYMHSLVFFVR